ncbi:MAG: lipoyl(octanoyl) transferase LipB [Dysgonamonadaceae bacterium]|jgi:lipoyl(octanoyl) transferase|nr:lipoyl(octanoyl) transferase LipB [Dysgonamonadaceae bacterium]
MNFIDWGIIPYSTAYEKQKELFEQALNAKSNNQKVNNTLIFCEHPHVITVGKNGKFSNLLYSENILKDKGVSLFHINRGGDVTYHGPGQLVVYPIFNLESFQLGLKSYIHLLEEVIIRLLAGYGIKSERLEGASGVWLDTDNPQKARKICAIGVKTSRYVTMHGLALNINTDLNYFRLINPCGFIDKGVTSMQIELGKEIDLNVVKKQLLEIFKDIFQQ